MNADELQNSRLFDPYRWSTEPQVKAACTELQEILGLTDIRYVPYVRMVLLDLYCSWRTDPLQFISYSRRKARYGKRSRYARIKVGMTCLLKLIDTMKRPEYGYIDHAVGVCYRDPVTNIPYVSYTSRMRATRKLIRLLVKHRVKLHIISRHPNEAVIYLRNKEKEDVKFDSMPRDVERSEKVLIQYNNLLQKTYIDIDDEFLTAAELDKMKKWDDQQSVEYSVDLSEKRVYRVFSNSNWNHNGRIFGAWWHSCPKQLRKYIILDGEPTVELDYSSIHILLLYAHLGTNFLDEGTDAYTVDGHDFRAAMKIVIMSAINAKPDIEKDVAGETKAVQAAWKTLITKCNSARKDNGINSHELLYTMLEALKERHKPIAEFLSSGKGIELMKQDSDIAIELIKQHTSMNVPILTVHDSFIVPMSFMPFTIDLMNQAYNKQVAHLLGSRYNSTIETIDCLNGTIQSEDTSQNINVAGLIKTAVPVAELENYITRWRARVRSNQLLRQYRWKKNTYQFNKLRRTVYI
jgi:hypothetical protein